MWARTSLPLLGALPLAGLALAACGGSASDALPTTSAFGGSWFTVSPAGAKVAPPPSQPQGGGGYGY
jgi:hypothetical protein